MRKLLVWSILCVMALAVRAQEDNADIVKLGDRMPAFTITRDNGATISSSFATWCPPCQKELADVQKSLWPKYKDRDDFVLLVVGREHTDADLVKYNERKGFDFPLYPDKNRAIFGAFAKNLIPRSYLVGKDGQVVYVTKGYTAEEFAELMEQIEKALK